MISFKKKDIIEHPNYGKGMIKKVTPLFDGLTALDIEFEEGGISKQFSAAWVERHCKYIEYVPVTSSNFKNGVYHRKEVLLCASASYSPA